MQADLSIQEAYSTVYYYAREKLWRTLNNLCREGEKKFGDPFFVFWRAYAIYREGNPSQAVTEIQRIESKKELQWASIKASIFYHRKCKNIDTATVDSLSYLERDVYRNVTERAVVASIYFDLFNEEFEAAAETAKQSHFDSPQMLVARGWIEIYTREEEGLEGYKKLFEEAIKIDSRNIEAYLGLCRLGEKVKKQQISQNALSDVLEQNAYFIPALIEKCRIGVFKKDFAMIKEGFQELLKIER